MKRLVVAAVLVAVITFGGTAGASPASEHVRHHVAAAGVHRAGVIECGAALFFGGASIVGGWLSFPANPVMGWIGLTGGAYSASQISRNQTCAAESFWDHVGYRKLCWQAHFKYWSPTGSGHAVFDNGDGACTISPRTADHVLCDFIKNPVDKDWCDQYWLYDLYMYQQQAIRAAWIGWW